MRSDNKLSPRDLFDAWAEDYESMRFEVDWSPFEHVDAAFQNFELQNARILDVGCGTGEVPRKLQALGALPYGLDISPEMCMTAAERSENIPFLPHDLNEPLPFDDDRFDAVIALGCLEYLPDIASVVDEFCRVLNKDGLFLGVFERCGQDCPGGDAQQVDFLDEWVRYRLPEDDIKKMINDRFSLCRFDRVHGFILEDTGEHTQYVRVIARNPKTKAV